MINVYFPLKGKGDILGAISLKEKDETGIYIWRTYNIIQITETVVLFQRNNGIEFCTSNGTYDHEMGKIKVRYIENTLLNINIQ